MVTTMLLYDLHHASSYIFHLIEDRKLALDYLTSKVSKKYDVFQFISLLLATHFISLLCLVLTLLQLAMMKAVVMYIVAGIIK